MNRRICLLCEETVKVAYVISKNVFTTLEINIYIYYIWDMCMFMVRMLFTWLTTLFLEFNARIIEGLKSINQYRKIFIQMSILFFLIIFQYLLMAMEN